ncbi:MAG TPA: hypothetical protein VG983_03770 [Caulobacterales bacterium]|nr:hypothetical protein [Caulobacterales bacterium]
MSEVEKLRAIRARLVVARRRAADAILELDENTRLPAEGFERIQSQIDALDRALSDEQAEPGGARRV